MTTRTATKIMLALAVFCALAAWTCVVLYIAIAVIDDRPSRFGLAALWTVTAVGWSLMIRLTARELRTKEADHE